MENKDNKKKIFVTAALPYCNNPPHLGNLIGSTLSADVMVRYLKKKNNDVMFLCGCDVYGTSTEIMALKENKTCKEICEKYSKVHESVYKWFNIDFTVFSSTSTNVHTELTQQIFNSLNEKKLLTQKTTEQYFCNVCDRFVCDRFIHGICNLNNCGGLVKGDECDKCCKRIDIDLIIKKWCSVCKNIPNKRETTHLYFELEPYKNDIINYFLKEEIENKNVENNTNKHIKYLSQSGKKLTKEWIKKDLLDRCITRDLVWGVPLQRFEEFPDLVNKVSWPWFDAPIGYISILANAYPQNWQDWINPNVDWYQFMAKDNVPFHTIIFPATLIGSEFQNLHCGVTHLSATEYLLFDKQKFSKSDGVGIFGHHAIYLSNHFNIDEDYWRYYLIKIRPESTDSSFEFKGFCDTIRGELAQKIGNLLNRILCMTKSFYNYDNNNNVVLNYDFTNFEDKFVKLKELFNSYQNAFEHFNYHESVTIINRIAEIGNEWINEQQVYNICKKGSTETSHLLGNCAFIMWLFSELAEPIMPNKALKIKQYMHPIQLNINELVTFDNMFTIFENYNGQIVINCEDTTKLFVQIKYEELVQEYDKLFLK